jgi:hypothetical protein
MKPTILIMYSWDDDLSRRRWSWHSDREDLAAFSLEQCFALFSEDGTVTAANVFHRATQAISDRRPTVFLFHTGAAYHRDQEEFARCAVQIKQAYPLLRLGFEHRGDETSTLSSTGVFEDSPEMSHIEHLIFG